MIHFDSKLVSKAIEAAKDADDLVDVTKDLQQIKTAEAGVLQFGDIVTARRLDAKLREKYPIIDEMLDLANQMSPALQTGASSYAQLPQEVSNLQQDYYGIICHIALKKGIVQSIKQFIKSVD